MELTVLAILCALIGLGCFGGIAWTLFGAEDAGVERIFLLLVWLLFGLIFLGLAGWIAKLGPLRRMAHKPAAESSPSPEAVSATEAVRQEVHK